MCHRDACMHARIHGRSKEEAAALLQQMLRGAGGGGGGGEAGEPDLEQLLRMAKLAQGMGGGGGGDGGRQGLEALFDQESSGRGLHRGAGRVAQARASREQGGQGERKQEAGGFNWQVAILVFIIIILGPLRSHSFILPSKHSTLNPKPGASGHASPAPAWCLVPLAPLPWPRACVRDVGRRLRSGREARGEATRGNMWCASKGASGTRHVCVVGGVGGSACACVVCRGMVAHVPKSVACAGACLLMCGASLSTRTATTTTMKATGIATTTAASTTTSSPQNDSISFPCTPFYLLARHTRCSHLSYTRHTRPALSCESEGFQEALVVC